MNTCEHSLRWLIEKWFAPTSTMPVRLTRFSREQANHQRFVCVEGLRNGGSLEIFFFRHRDGSWRVFPPVIERPTLRTDRPHSVQAC